MTLQELEWETANDLDSSDVVEDQGQWWDSYEDEAVPAPLRDVPGWPTTSAVIGQVGGVAVDTDGNVVVFHRADRRWDARFVDSIEGMKTLGTFPPVSQKGDNFRDFPFACLYSTPLCKWGSNYFPFREDFINPYLAEAEFVLPFKQCRSRPLCLAIQPANQDLHISNSACDFIAKTTKTADIPVTSGYIILIYSAGQGSNHERFFTNFEYISKKHLTLKYFMYKLTVTVHEFLNADTDGNNGNGFNP